MVQQQYDDVPVTFFYMTKVSQEVAAILSIRSLLLEGLLDMKVSRYFRSSYSIGTEGYKWDEGLDKVIQTGIDKYLEEIDYVNCACPQRANLDMKQNYLRIFGHMYLPLGRPCLLLTLLLTRHQTSMFCQLKLTIFPIIY